MLDQNTDRMLYVIGAVIIGAAIIFIMNNTFPQLFASIGETFGAKVDDTARVVTSIGDNRSTGEDATDGVVPLPKPTTNILDRTGELEHYFMYNGGEAPIQPMPVNEMIHHAATATKIAVTPGETIIFKKISIPGMLDTTEGGNWWRVSTFKADGTYANRFVSTDNTLEYVVPDYVSFIWPSYHIDSEPSILASR